MNQENKWNWISLIPIGSNRTGLVDDDPLLLACPSTEDESIKTNPLLRDCLNSMNIHQTHLYV